MLGAVPYTALLLDLDHTLLDSDASEMLAFERALASAGIADPGRYLPAYAKGGAPKSVSLDAATITHTGRQ